MNRDKLLSSLHDMGLLKIETSMLLASPGTKEKYYEGEYSFSNKSNKVIQGKKIRDKTIDGAILVNCTLLNCSIADCTIVGTAVFNSVINGCNTTNCTLVCCMLIDCCVSTSCITGRTVLDFTNFWQCKLNYVLFDEYVRSCSFMKCSTIVDSYDDTRFAAMHNANDRCYNVFLESSNAEVKSSRQSYTPVFYRVKGKKSVYMSSGCRNFTLQKAAGHWLNANCEYASSYVYANAITTFILRGLNASGIDIVKSIVPDLSLDAFFCREHWYCTKYYGSSQEFYNQKESVIDSNGAYTSLCFSPKDLRKICNTIKAKHTALLDLSTQENIDVCLPEGVYVLPTKRELSCQY